MKALLRFRTGIINCLLIICCCLSMAQANAQTFNFKPIEFDSLHTARYIDTTGGFNDTIVVSHDKWDEAVSSGTHWWNSNFKFKSVHAFVRFSIDHYYPTKVLEHYTFRLTYKVYGYANPAQPDNPTSSFNDTLTISFNPDSLATFQDKQYKKYSNFHKIMIVSTGLYQIDGAGGVPQLMDIGNGNFYKLNFNIEGAIITQPYNKNVKYSNGYKTAYGNSALLKAYEYAPVNDYLPISWNLSGIPNTTTLKLAPVKYELEWTYVDNYKVNTSNGVVSVKPQTSLNYNFRNNATRVWVDTNYYRIPLIYQKGHIVYRVRLVRPDSINYQYPVYGPWTIVNATGVLSSIATSDKYEILNAHINDSLNWQYTVSFAEQGKYKHVMSYYDGMLKNRQSITRFNSRPDRLIATEQVYDYEGRPSISILPTPLAAAKFSYQNNLAINSHTLKPYKASDFDMLPTDTVCPKDTVIAPLADISLADIYYSPNNPDKAGFQKFVPDAGGYPFVQTIYSPGYDERVEKQGGAGDTLQIGNRHNVKNDYVSTEQADLNKMFGTNIGWTGFYRKTVSTDPNGQTSLNITDYKGKTMMSSMIGLPDTTKHALVSNENLASVTPYEEDFIAGTTQQTIGNKIILDKNFYNEASGNNTALYKFTFTPFQTFCWDKYLSVKAKYDYSIFNECGTIIAQQDSIIGVTGVTADALPPFTGATLPFFMEKGKHSLHKELTINTDDIAMAVDSFMSLPAAEACLKDEPWFIRESVSSKQFPCPEGFGDGSDPCEGRKYQMMQELFPNMDSTNIVRKYGIYRIINGVVAGNGNSDFTLLCGQSSNSQEWIQAFSADTIQASSFGIGFLDTQNPFAGNNPPLPHTPFIVLEGGDTLNCKYRYQNDCIVTLPDTIYKYGVAYTGLQELPVEVFIDLFNDSIAAALLPLHPEYCKLLECVDDPYEKKLRSIPGGDIAKRLGLLFLDDIINADPILAIMQNSGNYPNPHDTLAFMNGGIMNLGFLALTQAYCGSSVYDMSGDCQSYIFANEIANNIILNDFIKEKYFRAIRDLYLANRLRYKFLLSPDMANTGGCATCQPVRMELVPEPVFPDNDADVVNVMEDFVTGAGSGPASQVQPGSPAASQSVVSEYFDLLDETNPYAPPADTLTPYSDSAVAGYSAVNDAYVAVVVDSMVSQFVNCITMQNGQPNFAAVDAYLMNLYNTGQVLNLQFTPDQVRAALVANNIKIDDLCNPYIVNYDGLLSMPENEGSGGMRCGSTRMFDDMTSFLNGTSLTALQNIGGIYHIASLDPNNQFEAALASQLGSSSCDVIASDYPYPSPRLYMLNYQANGQSVQIKFNVANNGTCQYPFRQNPGETLSIEAACTKDIFGGFPSGYIGNYSFGLVVKHVSSANTTICKLKAWTNKITLNSVGDNPISNCVPCTQMKTLYSEFWDSCNVYGMKGTAHPYYAIMLRNFMNNSLKKPFSQSQYLDFVESCALSDSMRINRYNTYADVSFSSNAAADAFLSDLNNLDPQVVVVPFVRIGGGRLPIMNLV